MDYGSSHVFVYENSDEEVISDDEYKEGMWLSDSDDDQPALPPPATPNKTPPHNAGPPTDLEGSATKYQHLPKDDDSSDAGDEGKKNIQPLTTRGTEKETSTKENLKYVDVDFLGASPGAGKPQTKRNGDPLIQQSARQNYARIDYDKQSSGSPPPPPPLPPPPPPPSSQCTPQITVQQVNEPVPRAPPLLPKKGIIKNRIAPGLNKMRRQRVKWEQQLLEAQSSHAGGLPTRRRARRADTNVLAVKFNTLTGPSHVHTGDAVVCSNPACTAILSHLSELRETTGQEESKEWLCEFCGSSTEVDIVEEEKPSKEDTTFLITPATVEGGGALGGISGVDDAMVIFCVDISGSMCVTTEVPGRFELKGHDRVRSLSSLNVDRQNQFLPRQRRDVTYVSRLQAVQAAVDHQLHSLSSSHPHQRVALITFGDEVTVVGDGRGEVVTVAGDKLYDSANLVKSGSDQPLPLPVKDTHTSLSSKVFALEEGGQTALGPALLLAVSMASRTPGSKVIICTDGLANKGVGTLDELATDEEQAEVQTFYEDLGTLAQEKNVTVSLVSIKGTDCRIMELGQVADKTGGQVMIVDPLNITKEFTTILANPVIATDVTTKIILHRDLYFRTEESKESVLVIPVGSVTAQTELTYEYGVRSKGRKHTEKAGEGKGGDVSGGAGVGAGTEVAPLVVDGKPHLPFQLQIEYTGQDGSRCMRVITQAKPITTNRGVAEKEMDMSVVGAHATHSSATLAMGGEYTQARLSAISSQRMLQKASKVSPVNRWRYNTLMEDLIPLENRLRDQQQSEQVRFGRAHSDDEEEESVAFYDRPSELMTTELARQRTTVSEPARLLKRPLLKKKKAISRRKEVPDDLATYCYQMRSSKSSEYSEYRQNDDSEDEED